MLADHVTPDFRNARKQTRSGVANPNPDSDLRSAGGVLAPSVTGVSNQRQALTNVKRMFLRTQSNVPEWCNPRLYLSGFDGGGAIMQPNKKTRFFIFILRQASIPVIHFTVYVFFFLYGQSWFAV